MYCPACGAQNATGSRACSNCGAGLADSCPQCGALLALGARFCHACGQPLPNRVTPAPSEVPTQKAQAPNSETEPALAQKELTPLSAGERKQVTVLFADF